MAAQGTGGSLVVLVMVVFLTALTLQAHVEGKPRENFNGEKEVNVSRILDKTDGKTEPKEATSRQFPWQVYLLLGSQKCGGSIIHEQWILTAAHCVYQKKKENELKIKAGVIKLVRGNFNFTYTKEETNAINNEYIYIHTKYDHEADGFRKYDYDIALIKLKQPLELNEKVQIIPLSNDTHDSNPSKLAITSGWGLMHRGVTGSSTTRLRYVEGLELKDYNYCEKKFNGFTNKLICTHTRDKGVLEGDSGGALIMRRGNSNELPYDYVQIGINNFYYYPPAPADYYANVVEFRPWIYETMANSGFGVCPSSDLRRRRSVNNNYCDYGLCHKSGCHCYPGYTGITCSRKETVCPEDRGFFTPTGSKQCFKLFKSKVAWKEAKQTCTDNGLALAHPWNAVELRSYIVQRYGLQSPVWLGARDDLSNPYPMKWESNGEEIPSNNPLWYTADPGNVQPQPGKDGCLILLLDAPKWKKAPMQTYWDAPCKTAIHYPLCEFFPEDPCKYTDCVNGKCHNGVCLCNSGYKGTRCSEKETGCSESRGFTKLPGSNRCFIVYFDMDRDWYQTMKKCRDEGLIMVKTSDEDAVIIRDGLVDKYGDARAYAYVWLDAKFNGAQYVWNDGELISNDNKLWYTGSHTSAIPELKPDYCLLLLNNARLFMNPSPLTPYWTTPCSEITHGRKAFCELDPSKPSV